MNSKQLELLNMVSTNSTNTTSSKANLGKVGRGASAVPATADWHTPPAIINLVKNVYGGTIDLDAASCAKANLRVGATTYYFL